MLSKCRSHAYHSSVVILEVQVWGQCGQDELEWLWQGGLGETGE